MMLPKLMKPFKLETKQEGKNVKVSQKTSYGGHDNHFRSSSNKDSSTSLAVGLRVLTHSSNSKDDHSHVVVKSAASRLRQQQVSTHDYCFLKTCNLCNKKFSPDKDIYMYRGDQGFCSIECRDRQIVLDEMGELETPTKQMRAYQYYHRHCCSDARKETRSILEDMQLQRHKSKTVPSNQKHWAIVS